MGRRKKAMQPHQLLLLLQEIIFLFFPGRGKWECVDFPGKNFISEKQQKWKLRWELKKKKLTSCCEKNWGKSLFLKSEFPSPCFFWVGGWRCLHHFLEEGGKGNNGLVRPTVGTPDETFCLWQLSQICPLWFCDLSHWRFLKVRFSRSCD